MLDIKNLSWINKFEMKKTLKIVFHGNTDKEDLIKTISFLKEMDNKWSILYIEKNNKIDNSTEMMNIKEKNSNNHATIILRITNYEKNTGNHLMSTDNYTINIDKSIINESDINKNQIEAHNADIMMFTENYYQHIIQEPKIIMKYIRD